MHSLFVLVYMQEDQEQPFEYTASAALPHGLFSRIIKRLGLEKELIPVKKHLGFFTTLLVLFLVLSIFAFIGVKHALVESSFGPFVSLIFSDPGTVIKYWHSFMFLIFESMPGIVVAALLFSVAFLMFFARLAVFALVKLFTTLKLINKSRF